jgi:hypothetical protein
MKFLYSVCAVVLVSFTVNGSDKRFAPSPVPYTSTPPDVLNNGLTRFEETMQQNLAAAMNRSEELSELEKRADDIVSCDGENYFPERRQGWFRNFCRFWRRLCC